MKKRVAILGSTGSIGTQALSVIDEQYELFTVEVLSANSNSKLLINQAIKYLPNVVVIGNKDFYPVVRDALESYDIKVYAGEDAISQVMEMDNIDIALIGIVGIHALNPILSALKNKKKIALANKESLVVAGELISKTAVKYGGQIIPVDSEHSAIFQCLMGELDNPIDKIVLTASGGPFLDKSIDYIKNVTPNQALNHPTWNMGNKVSVDSATLMNKGLEVIEARWLFNVQPHQIEVIVHPQSIVHSMVQFADGSIKAQMGLPDMKLPIQYAMAYPNRLPNTFPRFNFADYPSLTFEPADVQNFRNLALAYQALEKGGNMPCILNAANEVAVDAFLNNKIGFLDIPKLIEQSMQQIAFVAHPDYNQLVKTDQDTRDYLNKLI